MHIFIAFVLVKYAMGLDSTRLAWLDGCRGLAGQAAMAPGPAGGLQQRSGQLHQLAGGKPDHDCGAS